MSSFDRFYQLDLAHRSALKGDIGNLLKIEGVVVGGEGAQAVLMLPGTSMDLNRGAAVCHLDMEEWTDFLQRSDNPEVLVMPAKAFHRKLRYEISGAVQQKVWVADGFKCGYCGRKMGDVQMTVDHFIPLEMGGENSTANYLSCCRRENKLKGGRDPKEFCASEGYDYDFYVDYLRNRTLP